MTKLPEYEHDIEKEGQIEVDLTDDDGKKLAKAIVGVGHPGAKPDQDTRRVDEKGDPIVDGRPWSEADTGIWLCVGVANGPVDSVTARVYHGTQHGLRAYGAGSSRLFVATTDGLPSWDRPVVGAALEVPSDLGNDPLKRKYVTEWIAHTAVEALQAVGIGFNMNDKKMGALHKQLALEIAGSAQIALEQSGL